MYTEITDIPQTPAKLRSWVGIIPVIAALLLGYMTPWAYMWTIAFAIWLGCKWVMWSDAINRSTRQHSQSARARFFLGWPGMDAEPFLHSSPAIPLPLRPIIKATFCILSGALLLVFSMNHLERAAYPVWLGWLGMVGYILVLHFGLFDLMARLWRAHGVAVEPIMQKPLLAGSLSDFWRRWNRGFRDVAHVLVFRPLRRLAGPHNALWATFLFSGIIHDVVISIPAGSGYGLPTLYFLIQAAGIMVEKSYPPIGRAPALLKQVFMFSVFMIPLPLLFHPPFIRNIFIPFMLAIRSLIFPTGGAA